MCIPSSRLIHFRQSTAFVVISSLSYVFLPFPPSLLHPSPIDIRTSYALVSSLSWISDEDFLFVPRNLEHMGYPSHRPVRLSLSASFFCAALSPILICTFVDVIFSILHYPTPFRLTSSPIVALRLPAGSASGISGLSSRCANGLTHPISTTNSHLHPTDLIRHYLIYFLSSTEYHIYFCRCINVKVEISLSCTYLLVAFCPFVTQKRTFDTRCSSARIRN